MKNEQTKPDINIRDNFQRFSDVSILSSSCESCRTSMQSAWRFFMRLRRSWRTFGINRCRPARRGASTLWVCSRWWVHLLSLLQHLHRAKLLPASLSHFCPVRPGFSGCGDRGHHEEGIADGWPRCRRTKVLKFPKNLNTWLPTALKKKGGQGGS